MFQCVFVGRSYIDLYIEELIVLALATHILKEFMGEKSHEWETKKRINPIVVKFDADRLY